jgi:hypothetical protein
MMKDVGILIAVPNDNTVFIKSRRLWKNQLKG